MATVHELSGEVGVAQACAAMGLARSSYYRLQSEPAVATEGAKPVRRVPRAMSPEEREAVRAVLNSEDFVDAAPRTVYATLLDEGKYLCHWRSMYRILAEHAEVRERRDQLRHPAYAKPELLATGVRQLWSWDITKLRGPAKWQYFYLYVILDVFSRYVVGWMVAERESEALAQQLISETYEKEGVLPGELTLHADRGAAMTAKGVAQLMADLGVEPSHSRPHVSDDNPYSEAQFKTLKYAPTFPDRFADLAASRSFGQVFFPWYNTEHRHSGLAFLTPEMVHTGQGAAVLAERQTVLAAAYALHPERFVRGEPQVPALPKAVWINKPPTEEAVLAHQPALQATEPGAQPGSRADTNSSSCPAERTLEAGEHRASIDPVPARLEDAGAAAQ
jgi:putative transposase